MGVQVPRRFHPQVPPQGVVCGIAVIPWGNLPPTGQTEGEPDRGRAPAARPRAHDDRHSAQVRGVAGDWVYQREECDSLGAGVRGAEEEFCGAAFLGARILGVNRGPG